MECTNCSKTFACETILTVYKYAFLNAFLFQTPHYNCATYTSTNWQSATLKELEI